MKARKNSSAVRTLDQRINESFSNPKQNVNHGHLSGFRKIRSMVVLTALLILFVQSVQANTVLYKLTLEDLVYTSSSALEFSICIRGGDNAGTFAYSLGQYFIEFNPAIANSGSLRYSIVSSGLPRDLMPRNPSVSGSTLRLACNASAHDKNILPKISPGNDRFMVARVRLETNSPGFADVPIGLKWADGNSKFRSKIFALENNMNTDITGLFAFEGGTDDPGGSELTEQLPVSYSMSQNFPNPFNPSTTIRYSIPRESHVTIKVYDLVGKEVTTLVNELNAPGNYEITFNSTGLASGMYFYKISAGDYSKVMKMVLVK